MYNIINGKKLKNVIHYATVGMEMASRIKHRQQVPRDGYWFKEGDVTFRGNTLGIVYRKVRDYRLANQKLLSTPDQLMEEIEAQICQERPQLCVEDGGIPTVVTIAGNFVSAVARWVKSGFAMVDQATFDKRKAVCLGGCPHWRGWSDAGVGYCNTCGCPVGKVSLKLWMATEKCPDKPPRW